MKTIINTLCYINHNFILYAVTLYSIAITVNNIVKR